MRVFLLLTVWGLVGGASAAVQIDAVYEGSRVIGQTFSDPASKLVLRLTRPLNKQIEPRQHLMTAVLEFGGKTLDCGVPNLSVYSSSALPVEIRVWIRNREQYDIFTDFMAEENFRGLPVNGQAVMEYSRSTDFPVKYSITDYYHDRWLVLRFDVQNLELIPFLVDGNGVIQTATWPHPAPVRAATPVSPPVARPTPTTAPATESGNSEFKDL